MNHEFIKGDAGYVYGISHIDKTGRVLIPKAIRKTLQLKEGSLVKFKEDTAGNYILSEVNPAKTRPSCILCGNPIRDVNQAKTFNGNYVCEDCVEKIKKEEEPCST